MPRTGKLKFQKAFGAHLRKLRKMKGMSQEDLAHKANVTQSQIGRLETGAINTSIYTVSILARALDVEKKDLFDF